MNSDVNFLIEFTSEFTSKLHLSSHLSLQLCLHLSAHLSRLSLGCEQMSSLNVTNDLGYSWLLADFQSLGVGIIVRRLSYSRKNILLHF